MNSNLQDATLYYSKSTVTAKEALKKAFSAKNDIFTLIYTPKFCGFASYYKEELASLSGGEKLGDVFEIRCFCKDYELRWVREAFSDTGTAIVLREKDENPSWTDTLRGFFSQPHNSESKKEITCFLPGQYLLWGKIAAFDQNSATLFDHRVGKIKIPIASDMQKNIKEGLHVILTYKEYFRRDSYGNLIFFAERLTGMELYEASLR
jgi:CRISPR-associated protein (TIGR03984 family)